jgi:hypothetical protein
MKDQARGAGRANVESVVSRTYHPWIEFQISAVQGSAAGGSIAHRLGRAHAGKMLGLQAGLGPACPHICQAERFAG